jgi:hypothetical protein
VPVDTKPAGNDRLDLAIDAAIAVGVALLILIGFASSYRTLRDLATEIGGYPPWLAPAVPLSFDLGIVVLSLKVIRLAREGRSAPVLRLQVAALSVATVAANASAASTSIARLLHVVPPAMFVICFESIVITARRHALERLGQQPVAVPRISAARWLLAPLPTWRTWRATILGTQHPVLDTDTRGTAGQERRDSGAVSGKQDLRLEITRRALRERPTLTAVELAATLAAAGDTVSVRTAQRLRHKATQAGAAASARAEAHGPADA